MSDMSLTLITSNIIKALDSEDPPEKTPVEKQASNLIEKKLTKNECRLKGTEQMTDAGHTAVNSITRLTCTEKHQLEDLGYNITVKDGKDVISWENATKGHAGQQYAKYLRMVKAMHYHTGTSYECKQIPDNQGLQITDILSTARKNILRNTCWLHLFKKPASPADLRRIVYYRQSTYPTEIVKKDLEDIIVKTFPLAKITPVCDGCLVIDLI